jgi:hypothetical protein
LALIAILCTPFFAIGRAVRAEGVPAPDVKMTATANAHPGAAELEPLTVTGERLNGNVLPSNSLSPLFGTHASALDTPRSVTVLTNELLDKAHIDNIQSITRLASDSFSPNIFGVTSLPTIRGDLGSIFQNGLYRVGGNNGFGFPTSFNSVESIDVVKGPPPVFLGPTQRVGGYINLVTKKPYLDALHGWASLTGGSFDRYRGQLDVGGPITPGVFGFRASLRGVDDNSFYDFADTRTQDGYVALAYVPSAALRFDFNIEYYNADRYPDIAGINRPTQNLIDTGTYITGTGVSPNPLFKGIPGPKAVISPTGEVKLPRHQVLNDPKDRSRARDTVLNLTTQWRIDADSSFTDRIAFQHLSKFEYEQNSFTEIIDDDNFFENRATYAHRFALPLAGLTTRHDTVAGIDFRYHQVTGYSQFDTEADNPIDLTAPIASRRIPLPAAIKAQLVYLNRFNVYVSPGARYDKNGDGVNDFLISDTTGSDEYQIGVFYQDNIELTPKWDLLGAVRGDAYFVSATDPLPPPGFKAASDSTTHLNPSADASLTYHPSAASSLYLTYNYTQATINSLGGGFMLGPNNTIPAEDFNTVSELYEAGAKFSLLDSTLDLAFDGFEQTRSLRNRDGSITGIKTNGVELQAIYQPNGKFYATFSASYLNPRYDHSSATQGTRAVVDAFDDSRPDIIHGTGIGSPNFTAFAPSTARVQGLASVLVNAFANYTFAFGLSADLGVIATDRYKLDYLGKVHIPAQYTLNGGLSYRYGPLTVRADIFNITDQKNWSSVFAGGYFGATDVLPSLPLNYLLTVKYAL